MQSVKSLSLKSQILTQTNIRTQVLWIVGFSVLTAIGSWIEVPNYPVPFTLQTFFVLLSGATLGPINGAISQIVYLLMGIIGLPVFAGFGFGLSKILGPTGGYLLSFPVAAFVVGYLIQVNKNYFWTILTLTFGMLVIFSFGTLFLNFVYFNDWMKSIINGFFIFSWWDVVKVFAAASIYNQLIKRKMR